MNIPEMIPVESSNVDSVGYDGVNLFVKFKPNSLYVYFDVPSFIYEELMVAESKGSFLHQYVKKSYRYEKLVG